MFIASAPGTIQPSSGGAACEALCPVVSKNMPLLTELKKNHPQSHGYKHGAPDGAFRTRS